MTDAVVLPGGRYGPAAGMLLYASTVAERRGATIHRHEWTGKPGWPLTPGTADWAAAQITPLLDRRPLLIGKSLGVSAAGVAADRSLPAVWLTPLLTLPWVVDALERATAPFLLVGGTADTEWWSGGTAHRLTPHVLEIPNADHGLLVPGPLTDSIAVLARLVTAVENFLDAIRWPG
ncbi:alpha/beta hydrolase [Actinoplanes sp. NPDC051861]|uniref:alpha/beta hydrolase n=1 Tax=Actinoplanes sp. NPDC051861 TaxID=3155170 RepID=UPI00343595AB